MTPEQFAKYSTVALCGVFGSTIAFFLGLNTGREERPHLTPSNAIHVATESRFSVWRVDDTPMGTSCYVVTGGYGPNISCVRTTP